MRNRGKNKPVKVLSSEVNFRRDTEMVASINRAKGIINWGKDNNYGEYLRSLYKNQPQHAGIVKGKARYLAGTDIKGASPQGNEWLMSANPKESWQDLRKKYNEDYTLYGGIAIKIIPNLMGIPLWYFHVDYGKLRPSIHEDEVVYSDDWGKSHIQTETTTYPIWHPGCKDISIYIYRNYNPTLKHIEASFAGIEYESGIKSIDTLKRIQNFKNSLVANNFSSGTVITIFGGKPETKAEEDFLVNRIKGEHTGDEKAGNVVILFTDEEGKGAEIKSIAVNDLDKQFEGVTKSETINVFAAHNAPPDLFNYISDTAAVFDVNKIVEQNELFMNSYVIPTQEPELCMLEEFYTLRTGLNETFKIEQFKPIGLELPLENSNVVSALINKDPNIIVNYLNKKYQLGLTDSPVLLTPGVTPAKQVSQVNEHLKNLNGRQMQGIDRIVRKFKSGTYSIVQAGMLLKSGFGLTDQEVEQFLGQPSIIKQRIEFAKEIDFFAFMEANSHDPSDDEILEVNFVQHNVEFSAWQFADDSSTRNEILSKIKSDPSLTNEQIGESLGISAVAVAAAIAWLVAKKLLAKSDSGFSLTDKGKEAKKTTIYTEYNYGKRPDVKGPAIIATTREFCRKLYAKYGPGMKALTYAVIDNMTNQFGMNVWDFRGGFYNDPVTHETEPYCRHGWFGTTKIKYENG